jgi:hypothetical protein
MRSRDLAWLLVGGAALTGCRSCKGQPNPHDAGADAAVIVDAVDAAAPIASAAPIVDAGRPPTAFERKCADQAKKNHAAFVKAGTATIDDGTDHVIQCTTDSFDICVPDDETSGWMVTVDDNVKIDGRMYSSNCVFTWNLVYFEVEKGIRDSKKFKGEAAFDHLGPERATALEPKSLFLLREHTMGSTAINPNDDAHEGTVYTFADGKIGTDPRLKGRKILDGIDVDKDGKLDFELQSPFVVRRVGAMGMNVTSITIGPKPVAHRTENGYSFDDDTAKQLVRADCPNKQLELDDDMAVDRWLPCARFWNIPRADIAKELSKICNVYIETGAFDGPGVPGMHDAGECPSYLQDWMTLKLPWTLE